jgi:hypothetical protein
MPMITRTGRINVSMKLSGYKPKTIVALEWRRSSSTEYSPISSGVKLLIVISGPCASRILPSFFQMYVLAEKGALSVMRSPKKTPCSGLSSDRRRKSAASGTGSATCSGRLPSSTAIFASRDYEKSVMTGSDYHEANIYRPWLGTGILKKSD